MATTLPPNPRVKRVSVAEGTRETMRFGCAAKVTLVPESSLMVRGYVVCAVRVGVTPVGLFSSDVVIPQPVRRVKERTRAINVRIFSFNIV